MAIQIRKFFNLDKTSEPVQFPRHLKPIEPQAPLILQQERDRATFSSEDLKNCIYGEEYLEKRDRVLQILQNDPTLGDKSHRYYNGRDFRFKKSLDASKRLHELER